MILKAKTSSHKLCIDAGGTFSLYSLLCRHAKVGHLPNKQAIDEELSTYKLEQPRTSHRSHVVERFFEKHQHLRSVLLVIVLLGTCMVICDGVLTPAISGKPLRIISIFVRFNDNGRIVAASTSVLTSFSQFFPPSQDFE
jgi:hypothetical protein